MRTRRSAVSHLSTHLACVLPVSGHRLPAFLVRGAHALSLSFFAVLILGADIASAALSGSGSYAPPASGAFAYDSFVPALTTGASYVDPVFGETVKRLTTDHGHNDLYARNMWWNADETRYLHRTAGVAGKADRWNVVDVATGTVTHTGIPFGTFAADGGFDPADPNTLYYLVSDRGDGRGEIRQITLKTGGAWTETVYFTAPARIADLGGTLNWLDASGRYMLVRYGAEPSVHVYDRQNLGAGPYANPIDATNSIERGGYLGLTPDGRFVVGYDDRPIGFGGMGQGVSWKIDHANRAIAAAPTIFWSLCGDHGSFLSASDGRNYMIVNDCYSQPGLWRVDITNNADGLNESQQVVLPNNARILGFPTWNDFGHVSTVARGAFRDWVFLASEDVKDTFNSGTADPYGNISPWHPYRQEIIAINVITGEIRRLAHHRSRSLATDYYSFPRVSASWGGAVVGFASNFNQPGGGTPIVDVYAIRFAQSAPVTLSVTRGGTGSGTITSAPAGINCGSSCSAPFAIGTVVTLTATAANGSTFAGWNGPCTGTATCTVPLNAAASVAATFNTVSTTFSLAVTKAGTGGGTVTSSPAGISCGATCSATFNNGAVVTLATAPATGSTFAGWSGACSGTSACTVATNVSTSATATFNIPTSVTASPASLAPGGSVTATWSGIATPSPLDWIGLYSPGSANTAFLAWVYVSCSKASTTAKASGSCPLTLSNPLASGTYELRLLANNGFTSLATSNAFSVSSATNTAPAAPTTLGQFRSDAVTTIAVGATTAETSVVFKGVLSDPDAGQTVKLQLEVRPLTTAFSDTATHESALLASGSLAAVTVPSLAPGTSYHWQARAVDDQGAASSWTPFGANAESTPDFAVASSSTTLSVSPISAAPGSTVTATWSGIATPTPLDWIGLYAAGGPDTAFLAWTYLSCSKATTAVRASGSCPFTLPTPLISGTYELRLFANNGFSRLATSGPLTVP